MHADDQKGDDIKGFFLKLGKSFRDVDENKMFRITSVVKKGQERKLYYRFYDTHEYPSGPPRISPFYDNVEEDPFEYTHCTEILSSRNGYVLWADDVGASLSSAPSSSAPAPTSSSSSSSSAPRSTARGKRKVEEPSSCAGPSNNTKKRR